MSKSMRFSSVFLLVVLGACGPRLRQGATNVASPVTTASQTATAVQQECPAGTKWSGTRCEPIVSTECDSGFQYREGKGCVPISLPDMARSTHVESAVPVVSVAPVPSSAPSTSTTAMSLMPSSPKATENWADLEKKLPLHADFIDFDRIKAFFEAYQKIAGSEHPELKVLSASIQGLEDNYKVKAMLQLNVPVFVAQQNLRARGVPDKDFQKFCEDLKNLLTLTSNAIGFVRMRHGTKLPFSLKEEIIKQIGLEGLANDVGSIFFKNITTVREWAQPK